MGEISEIETRLVIGPYPTAGHVNLVIISLIQARYARIKERSM